jgi:uncharacterized protein (DUF952 family)
MATIYKIAAADEWRRAEAAGLYLGSADDLRDGFIHFSTASQVRVTAARHYAGRGGLVLIAFDATVLGPGLRREPSRGGELFPHLYGPLDPKAALWVRDLPAGPDGRHQFPDLPA